MKASDIERWRRERQKMIEKHGLLGPCLVCGWTISKLSPEGWVIEKGGHLCPACVRKLVNGSRAGLGAGWFIHALTGSQILTSTPTLTATA